MPAPDFLDANVLVYAYDASDRRKRQIAQELVRSALAGEFVISTQVLAEFAATLLHKISPPLTTPDVIVLLDALAPIRAIASNNDLVRRAAEAHQKYGIHFYDGMIVAAAEHAGCERIWSEDLNAGGKYFSVTIANPF
jgi:predicted nucleic acid-binding protein